MSHPNAGACLRQIKPDEFHAENKLITKKSGAFPIVHGDWALVPAKVKAFVAEMADLMQPKDIYILDGSDSEGAEIRQMMVDEGALHQLTSPKYHMNWIIKTDPSDVARVESKTCISTKDKYDTVCHTKNDAKPLMGNWWSPEEFEKNIDERFPGCMKGRTMYVIPVSMGPIGSHLSRILVEVTDSKYVCLCMRLMTRVSPKVWEALGDANFVRGTHSMGLPKPEARPVVMAWPCNPEKVMIGHRPEQRQIWSFGSGYGGNSLLGKKCLALRIASVMARDEGWMAEHMLIMSVTNPAGKERFITGAFPSACGKTNLAMLEPLLPGYKVKCVGDDIAWMRFRKEDGQLVGINPEYGFFGVAPGTSYKTNPMAMETFQKNSIMTNTAETVTGEYFWEGLEDEMTDKSVEIITWLGEKWHIGDAGKAAQPNSRFTTPAGQCPIIHPRWEDSAGVPIDAFIFGGRRPVGVPLVFESFSWNHGIFVGMSLKSEATTAAEHKAGTVMHDPMAMRPFMGYNFGKYMQHWINLGKAPNKPPRIYHVNWFRVNKEGKFIWPGFGHNIRVLDWIMRRLDGDESIGQVSPIGIMPKKGSINSDGINVDWDELLTLPKDYWVEDTKEIRNFAEEQIGPDMPKEIRDEMDAQEKRILAMTGDFKPS
jgi:phosphoenolpyruvate carboxykinase (GTP)